MPKIGNPLPIDQRQSVQESVLVPDTSQPSTNLQTLRVNYMPYQIGQETASSQNLLREEMGNLVSSVVKAKVITEQINQQYALNNFDKQFDNTDRMFREKMSRAFEPESQNAVITEYRKAIELKSKEYSKIFPKATPEQQKYVLQRLSKSLSKATVMEGTYNLTKFKQTDANLQSRIKDYQRNLTKSVAIDAKYEMEKGIEAIEKRFNLGAISFTQMKIDTKNFVRDSTYGRAELFARRHGNEFAHGRLQDGSPFPTQEEVMQELYEKLGLYDVHGGMFEHTDAAGLTMHKFSEDEKNDIYDIYSKAFAAKLRQENSEFAAQENTNVRLFASLIAEDREKIEMAKERGTLTAGFIDQKAQSYLHKGMPTLAAKLYQEWNVYDNSAPIDLIVQKMTDKEGEFYAWAQDYRNGIVRGNGTLDVVKLKKELQDLDLHQPTMYKVLKFYRDQIGVLEDEYTKSKLETSLQIATEKALSNITLEYRDTAKEGVERLSANEEFFLRYTGKLPSGQGLKLLHTRGDISFVKNMQNEHAMFNYITQNVRARVREDFRTNQGFFAREVYDDGPRKGARKNNLSYKIAEKDGKAYVLDTRQADDEFNVYIQRLLEQERQRVLPETDLAKIRGEKFEETRKINKGLRGTESKTMGGSR